MGIHSPGHVADTDEQAKAEFWPRWREIIALIAPERGFALPTEESFDWETGPHGALYVGSPEAVAQKIVKNLRALGATRFDLKYGMPGLTHDQLMTNIELYGRQVVPRVRELLSRPSRMTALLAASGCRSSQPRANGHNGTRVSRSRTARSTAAVTSLPPMPRPSSSIGTSVCISTSRSPRIW